MVLLSEPRGNETCLMFLHRRWCTRNSDSFSAKIAAILLHTPILMLHHIIVDLLQRFKMKSPLALRDLRASAGLLLLIVTLLISTHTWRLKTWCLISAQWVISNETRILNYSSYVVVGLLQQSDAEKTHLLSPKAGGKQRRSVSVHKEARRKTS